MAGTAFRIVEAIYPGMTQLDFTGLTRCSAGSGAETIVASERRDDRVRRAASPSPAPGGWPTSTVATCSSSPAAWATAAMNDPAFMREAKRLAAGAAS